MFALIDQWSNAQQRFAVDCTLSDNQRKIFFRCFRQQAIDNLQIEAQVVRLVLSMSFIIEFDHRRPNTPAAAAASSSSSSMKINITFLASTRERDEKTDKEKCFSSSSSPSFFYIIIVAVIIISNCKGERERKGKLVLFLVFFFFRSLRLLQLSFLPLFLCGARDV